MLRSLESGVFHKLDNGVDLLIGVLAKLLTEQTAKSNRRGCDRDLLEHRSRNNVVLDDLRGD